MLNTLVNLWKATLDMERPTIMAYLLDRVLVVLIEAETCNAGASSRPHRL